MDEIKILVIEDDADIREGIRILLESEGFHVDEAENGETGLQKLSADVSLVILDIMMPGMSGFRVCSEIRKKSYVPILFLSAKAQESDKLLGLMAGGDDYLSKPFSYAELLGRVKAQVRRYTLYSGVPLEPEKQVKPEYLKSGGIRIHTVFNESIWNEPYFYNCSGTVMVHIRKLRVKIESDSQSPVYIKTVWGKGYRFESGE